MGAERLPAPTRSTFVSTTAHYGDPGQGGAVSVGPIWHVCIAIRPAKHRSHHRGSNLGPLEQTTDKKLLQNVNGRMKQNRIDKRMKICGKID